MYRIPKLLLVSALLMSCTTTTKQLPPPSTFIQEKDGVLTVTNDRGGHTYERFDFISELEERTDITQIRIIGYCNSACTFYLKLKNVCTYNETTFGFHGPSYGNPLDAAARFARDSQTIASYYPPAVAAWFLKNARYLYGHDYLTRTGEEFIQKGYLKKC